MTKIYKPDYLEVAVYNVLDALTNEEIVYGNQQGPEVTPPYVLLTIDSRIRQGQDTLFTTLSDGTNVYHGDRHGGITLLVVGDLCGERADELVNALQRRTASQMFREYGPVLHSVTPVNLGPLKLDGCQYEQAVAIDVQFRVRVVHAEIAGVIEYVVIKYDLLTPDGKNVAHDAIVAALQHGKLEDKVYAVVLPQPPAHVLKVGGFYPYSLRILPGGADFNHLSYDYDPTRIDLEDVNGVGVWNFLKAGPARIKVTAINNDGSRITDEIVLQITD